MNSIRPETFAPRYVDLRQAVSDGNVDEREARTLIAPHQSFVETDALYQKSIRDLLDGKMRLPSDGFVQVTFEARSVLAQMLESAQAARGPRVSPVQNAKDVSATA